MQSDAHQQGLQDIDGQVLTYPLLLDASAMQAADRSAVDQGVDSFQLMHNAAQGICNHVISMIGAADEDARILVLAGPGNNGGDGLVAGALLRDSGYVVSVVCLCPLSTGQSDAAKAATMWGSEVLMLDQPMADEISDAIDNATIIIDALFGAGLSRPLDEPVASLVQRVNLGQAKLIAVDVPSGLDGNSHLAFHTCIAADSTVTFFRFKPAHVLYPGRALCGTKHLVQIGLTEQHVFSNESDCQFNCPAVFADALPRLPVTGHKFDRGHVLVRGGPIHATGAARLSANTALSSGAGLVTLATSTQTLPVNASHLTAVMLAVCDDESQWHMLLEDKRITISLLGPANGTDEATRVAVKLAIKAAKPCVLDADALSCWQGCAEEILPLLAEGRAETVLTPHAGEFERLFANTQASAPVSKLHQAKQAAVISRSIVVFKGADTVVAAPDGRACINANAPPWLATAGAGDVLAGLIASLMAQGMPAFEAACAAVWLHGAAAVRLGYPLNAEQLVAAVGTELSELVKYCT